MRSTVTVLLLLAVSYSRSDDDKIIGGYECPPHSQPWQIYLTYDDGQRWCGASLINEKWAVSAAHCYIPLALHLGEHHVFIEEGTEQRIWAEKVIPHPDYNKETFDNDIMLIKLSQPAVLNAFVQPIPLATTCAKEGDQCLVSGWGDQSINDVNYASVLQCLDVPVLPRSTCEASIPQNITENMFCAGFFEGGKDSCQGDSGGPIVCNGKLQGVVSWGIMCAMPDLPGVYVEVCRYGDWIKDIMANN